METSVYLKRTRGLDTVLYSYIVIFMHLFLAMAMIEQAHRCSKF